MKNITLFLCALVFLSQYTTANAQPTRKWATYYGEYADYGNHNQREVPSTIVSCSVYDKNSGYLYITGTTTDSTGIATPGSFQPQFHSTQMSVSGSLYRRAIFLAKFDTLGNRIWATYYGGNRDCQYPAIALDSGGHIYLSGTTNSDSGIATSGSHQPIYPGQVNINYPGLSSSASFLAKFDSNGQRLWATYYGGAGGEGGGATCIAYDPQSDGIYIAGGTADSAGIATPGSFKEHLTLTYDPVFNVWEGADAYVAKFNSGGVLQWGTYYGGTGTDNFWNIRINETGEVYLMGATTSDSGIATPGSDKELMTGISGQSTYLVKFDSNGQRLWGTYVGEDVYFLGMTGTNDDGNGGGNAIYISGYTMNTANNTTANAYQPNFGGGYYDMVLSKYNGSGVKQWGTYYGGPGDEPISITPYYYNGQHTLSMDNKNNLLMVGITSSTQGIKEGCHTYPAVHQTSFISKWSSLGNPLWSSYYDAPLFSVCTGSGNNFYVAGTTTYDSLATPGALQTTKVTDKPSGIIARFIGEDCPNLHFSISTQNNQLSVDSGYASYQWYNNGNAMPGANQHQLTLNTNDTGFFYVLITDSCGCLYTSDTVTPSNTGISEQNNNGLSVSLAPNPNNGRFVLRLNALNTGNQIFYKITDFTGRVVLSSVLYTHSNTIQKEFDLSYLPDGIYLIHLWDERNDGGKTIKFVKRNP